MTDVIPNSAEQLLGKHSELALLSRAARDFAEATTDFTCLVDVVARRVAESFDADCEVHCTSETTGELSLAARHVRQVDGSGADNPTLLVPLCLHGRRIGALRLQRPRGFDERERQFAQLLAEHAALALGNAWSYIVQADAIAKRDEQALRQLSEQLRHAQKMEAVGRLAGGIAHDFNNVLSAILGYADLIYRGLAAGDPMRADVEELRRSGRRAADLTKQLLMFSRRQVLSPQVVDLRSILSGMQNMLERMLGEDIELQCRSEPELGLVEVDPTGIEQVLMNLVVNARDAMPQGGKLTLEASNLLVDERVAREQPGLPVGPCVLLTVTDNGLGMDEATRAQVFEPFFTTKELGKGTGLGLAIVFGIVKQSGGHVGLCSEVGVGTRVKLYLPRCDKPSVAPVHPPEPEALAGGDETILLVEDQDEVRQVAGQILRQSGYHVLPARDAVEAQAVAARYGGRIDLLLSDVIMPRMNGPELAERLMVARAELKVLCMSGYPDDNVLRHAVIGADLPFLQKPFTSRSLTAKVREVLDRRSD
ncbi:MAG: ATP-binding protein [Polyangiales bacterium]